VKASMDWQTSSGAQFSAGGGSTGFANLQNYTARYCVWGTGTPIVLVPGLAGGFELLGPLASWLARDFQVISYQLRGEDDCFALRRQFGLADLVGDLHEFLDFMGLEQPPVFGVSFGGLLAMELAASHPHRLQSMILQGAGVWCCPVTLCRQTMPLSINSSTCCLAIAKNRARFSILLPGNAGKPTRVSWPTVSRWSSVLM
jgi:pimeloyl-ACP methyl ester carboxylesterase